MSDFNLFICKIFSSSDLVQFHLYLIFKKKLFILIISNIIYYKISIWQQKLLYKKKKKNFTSLFAKVFQVFSFKKSDLYKLFKNA